MVTLKAVQESNATLSSSGRGKTALFVGAASGIGLATLTEYVRHANRPNVYITGRNEGKLQGVVADLQKINPDAHLVPIRADLELLRNVDKACAEVQSKVTSLDLLFLSIGEFKYRRLREYPLWETSLQSPWSCRA